MEQNKIQALKEAINRLESELRVELAKKTAGLRYGLERGRAVFEQEILRRHIALKVNLWKYIKRARLSVILTSPIIYSAIIPIVFLDLFVTFYQHTCFRIYHIPRVKRGDYFVFERAGLKYLNFIQMVNCAYCSYGNGVIAYCREIFARTEQYWCPIKHAKKVIGYHERYENFAEFGDVDDFMKKYMNERLKNSQK